MAHSSIVSHGAIKSTPDETYGSGPLLFRVGNGGAGATGLIRALAEAYLCTRPGSVSWTMNHSRNTQLALLHGHIDLALTYERDQEAISVHEGWARDLGAVFHDHFVLAGPVSDPARVAATTSLSEAMKVISDQKALFHSRADFSATMIKEHALWEAAGVKPRGDWYVKSELSPGDALINAARCGAYLVSDRSTLLKQTGLGTVEGLTVFFEPEGVESVLMNSCYALSGPSEEAEMFVRWAQGPGQDVVRTFGGAPPLFATLDDGYARDRLRGGRPEGGKWVNSQE